MKIILPAEAFTTLVNSNRHELIHSSNIIGCNMPADIDTLEGFISSVGDEVHKLMDPIIAATQICIDLYMNAIIIPDTKQIIFHVNHDKFFELLLDDELIQQFGYTRFNHDEYKRESGLMFVSLPSGVLSDSVYIFGTSSIIEHVDFSDFFNQVRLFCRHKDMDASIERPASFSKGLS